jgi:hypothetical protein
MFAEQNKRFANHNNKFIKTQHNICIETQQQ